MGTRRSGKWGQDDGEGAGISLSILFHNKAAALPGSSGSAVGRGGGGGKVGERGEKRARRTRDSVHERFANVWGPRTFLPYFSDLLAFM